MKNFDNFDQKIFISSKNLVKKNDPTNEIRGKTYLLNPELQYQLIQEKSQVRLVVADIKGIVNGKNK